ncbi:MAG TPA: hypothetical protein VK002_06160 [Rubricoccaceae bacterium]|nr:hypothetical protein [Rubricoccaceae bacterium]
MPDEPINFYKEAFMSPVNLVFLISALVAALLTGGIASNLVLLFAAAAELMYLGTVPRSERYRRVVRSRKAAERNKPPSDREILRSLHRDDQKRYVRFRNIEKAIRDNFAKLSYASQGMLDAHLQKIDGLLDSYLNLLQLKDRYLRFAQRTGEEEIVRAINGLRAEMEQDPPRVRQVKARRLQILQKRLDKFKKANENLDLIEAQLATIEDVTRYVYEQSLTMQNPEEVSFQLDTLVSEVEETQASVEALEEAFSDPLTSLSDLDIEAFEATLGERAAEPRLDTGLLDEDLPEGGDSAPRTRDRERS